MIKENKFYSYNLGELPEGCKYCVKGEKLVLFVTGICPRKCYFCPLSDQKYGKDVTFANERKVNDFQDIITEAKNMDAKGAGITGGDPLIKIDRTIESIKLLKQNFGKNFHIHLYTSLNLVNENNLNKLYESGLDEIRFHPDLDSKTNWEKINLAKKFKWDIGLEIPIIPTKFREIKELIKFAHDKITFINLNELEFADNELSKLGELGFETKDEFGYAVKGSVECGLKVIDFIKKSEYKLKAHLCTAKLKDRVQLTNRIKREGRIVKRDFDKITNEGLLIRGALYLPGFYPGLTYENNKDEDTKNKLDFFYNKVKDILKVKDNKIAIDYEKSRILLSENNAKINKKKLLNLGLTPAIVTEYPTADQFETEVEILK